MRPTLLLASVAALAAFALPACRRQEPLPPPPPPAKPVSLWSEAVSADVAKQLVEAATRDPWTSQFRDRNSRAAKIEISAIEDRSGRAVPVAEFTQAISAAITAQGGEKLALASDGPADFTIKGAIGSQEGSQDGQAVVFFAVDLKFIDTKTGEPVWPFSIERPVSRP